MGSGPTGAVYPRCPVAWESGSVELAAATQYVPVLIVRAPARELFADDQRSLLLLVQGDDEVAFAVDFCFQSPVRAGAREACADPLSSTLPVHGLTLAARPSRATEADYSVANGAVRPKGSTRLLLWCWLCDEWPRNGGWSPSSASFRHGRPRRSYDALPADRLTLWRAGTRGRAFLHGCGGRG
jgi:hypothetical protein